jgi:hypothetical protein
MIYLNKLLNSLFHGKYTMVILPASIGLLCLSLAFGLMYIRAKEAMKASQTQQEHK